ncbi:MAG: hypothetical protein Q4A01_01785 [Coriobacteriales bacterium]|nr:hypothetical protein [Coriobacteriales bacterium]
MDTRQIHITGSQALMLMRAARAGRIVAAQVASMPHVAAPPQLSSLEDLGIADILTWLGVSAEEPLDVLSCSTDTRMRVLGVRAHVLGASLPPNTVLELKQVQHQGHKASDGTREPCDPLHWNPNTRVFVDGPPLALVRVAHRLEQLVAHMRMDDLEAQLRLIALACEFCGSYAREPFDPRGGPCHYDEPGRCDRLISPRELQTALRDLRGVSGLARARRAAAYALDFSGSPMETYVDLGLFLPPRLAGLSLRMPLLNQQIEVPKEVRHRLRHTSLRPDMHWPNQSLLGEYFGDDEHASKRARVEDKNRMQDYATAGYAPVLLMFDDVRNATALNRTAQRLARMLMERGVSGELYRVRRTLREEGFAAKQRVLVKTLLPPVRRYEGA